MFTFRIVYSYSFHMDIKARSQREAAALFRRQYPRARVTSIHIVD